MADATSANSALHPRFTPAADLLRYFGVLSQLYETLTKRKARWYSSVKHSIRDHVLRPSVASRGDSDVNTSASPARILVVEDQDDVRRMLVTALELEGHRVDEATNAVEGLNRLRGAQYNLVLSDYAMPGHTGTWMFSEATRLRLLNGAAMVIVTAHLFVRETPDIPVISKPFDLDSFLNQVRRLLDSHGRGLTE